jgi:hypothetical protein
VQEWVHFKDVNTNKFCSSALHNNKLRAAGWAKRIDASHQTTGCEMSRARAWGVDDGRRKGRYAICVQIELMLEAMTPDVWFEPHGDHYIRGYRDLTKRASGVTRSRGWHESMVVEFVEGMFSRQKGGWMARAAGRCEINRVAAARLADALNTFDGSDEALWNLVKIASSLVNDSMVGASKFLHFCLPHLCAITDQYLRLVSGTPTPGDPNAQAEYFRTYMAALSLVKRDHAKQAMQWASKVFGYRVTRIRAIEAFVFYHVREFDKGRLPALRAIIGREPRNARKPARRHFCSCSHGMVGANSAA